jgi:hypothetical protein
MLRLLLGLTFVALSSGLTQGQTITSMTCSPSSCQDTGPLATVSVAQVDADVQCSNGQGWSITARAIVGFPSACSLPYQPHARVDRGRTTLLDDCGSPYDVDRTDIDTQIWDASGNIVFHRSASRSCDGGVSNPSTFGTQPC